MNFEELKRKYLVLALGIIFLIIGLFLLVANIKLYRKQHQLADQTLRYEQEISRLEDSNKSLEEKIENYDNPDYIEKVAREEANMKRPGEQVVSFILPEAEAAVEEKKSSFWTAEFWRGVWKNVFK